MALPAIIEYINSLVGPGGAQLATQAARQDVIELYPPQHSQAFVTFPAAGTWANIVYAYSLGVQMIPNVFEFNLSYGGGVLTSGVLTQDYFEKPIDFFMVVTQNYPITLTLVNRDIISHYFEANLLYLNVPTKEALTQIGKALAAKEGTDYYLTAILKALNAGLPPGKQVEIPNRREYSSPVYVP